jgi:hypothetical protein
VVSFTPRPLYPQGKSSWYPLGRRLGGPQSRSGRGGEEVILYLLLALTVKLTNERTGRSDDSGSIPGGGEEFFFRHHVQTGSGAHPASYPMGTGGSFPGDKAAGAKGSPLHPVPASKMRGAIPPLSQYVFVLS